MAIGVGPSPDGDDEVIAAINTTPLVDVMLVLLIIFLITIPVVTTSVALELPRESVEVRESRPENIVVSVDREGAIYWHDLRLSGPGALRERLAAVAGLQPQPEVQIRGDMAAAYESVGRVLLACQRAGIARVSFITEPPGR
ncbi:MAG: biopolymer transporter ExbD [Betaproteobacteria bacterium]|nr:biopolymer transporter ExbD [Betaproteobacteria bacterium]